MPLHQFVDSGGEFLLSYAKQKIKEMHARMSGSLRVLNKTILTDAASTIYLHSQWMAEGVYNDTIRITAGGEYLVGVAMPDPTPYRSLFLDTITSGDVYSSVITGTTNADNSFQTTTYEGFKNGVSLGTVFGTNTLVSPHVRVYVNWANIPGDGFNSSTLVQIGQYDPQSHLIFNATYDDTQPSGSRTVGTGDTPAPYTSFLNQQQAAGANRLQVTMSDGTALATVPQTTTDGTTFTPTWVTTAWDGTSSAATTAGSASFVVPPDTNSSGKVAAEAIAREKARLQTNSTNAINLLKAGVMPPPQGLQVPWGVIVKSGAPDSVKPRQVSAFTAALSTPELSDFIYVGTPNTVYGPTTVTRGLDLSYADAQGNVQSINITGTWTQQSVKVIYQGLNNYVLYNTYSNFPIFSPATGLSLFNNLSIIDGAPVEDGAAGTGRGIGQFINGTKVVGDNNPDSSMGTPTDPTQVIGFSQSSQNISVAVVPFYLQYLAAIKPVSVDTLAVDPGYSSNWLSTSMVPGEIITLIPFSPVLSGEDLGMFGPTAGATQVATYGYATFTYNIDGSFTFGQWHDNPQVDDMLDASGAAITWPGTNCIVKYTKFGWKDTQATAAAQALTLTNPVTNGDKFLKLIKGAQGI